MALVKKSALASRKRSVAREEAAPVAAPAPLKTITRSKRSSQSPGERIVLAAAELASGVAQSAGAAEELRRALEQIAAAAEEAAGAAHESLGGVASLAATFAQSRAKADEARLRSDTLQTDLTETAAMIEASVAAIEANTQRQMQSVEIVGTLARQAADIGQISTLVADIADQTNLLALNAAIEAERAGDDGRGFTIVADEVRALAVTAEQNSRQIQTTAQTIVADVGVLADRIEAAAQGAAREAQSGKAVAAGLVALRAGLTEIVSGAHAILMSATEADAGVREAQKGAESVSSAAEEQSAAATEAQRAVQQQASALEESRRMAENLASAAEMLSGKDNRSQAAEEIGAAAEELSATVQELSGAAGEILTAIDQISRGAQIQAAATQQSNAALTEIGRAAEMTSATALQALARTQATETALGDSADKVGELIEGATAALGETRGILASMGALEESARTIEKLVDAIALVTVQTTMLSVSGAVEAARVGEAGRGFSVVSGEIRGLARESAANTEQVKDIVRSLQRQVIVVRSDLEQIAAFGEAENHRNRAVAARLADQVAMVVGLREGALEISRGANDILAASRQVAAGSQQIAVAAEEAASAAAQSAAAAREQAVASEDLAAVIEEIASLAEELLTADGG